VYQISNIKTNNIKDCISISNQLLGTNYHDKPYFENAVKSNRGIVVIKNKEVVGFLIHDIIIPIHSQKMYGENLDIPVGHIDSVCVSPSFQRNGIASLLIKKAIEILQKKCTSIYTLAWEYNGVINLKSTLNNSNFNEVNTLTLPWKNQCEKGEFICPVKEKGCICSGIVYKIDII